MQISGSNQMMIFLNILFIIYMTRVGKALTKGFEDGFKDLNKYLRRHYLTKSYRFHSIVPIDRNSYFSIPRQQWKKQKQEWNMLRFCIYMGFFVVGFAMTDSLYSLYNNPKQSYRLYLYYPKYTKFIDDIVESEHVRPWLQLAGQIWVKDYVQFRAFWQKFTRLLNQKKILQKKSKHDQKVKMLKQQMIEINKKYPLQQYQDNSNVF